MVKDQPVDRYQRLFSWVYTQLEFLLRQLQHQEIIITPSVIMNLLVSMQYVMQASIDINEGAEEAIAMVKEGNEKPLCPRCGSVKVRAKPCPKELDMIHYSIVVLEKVLFYCNRCPYKVVFGRKAIEILQSEFSPWIYEAIQNYEPTGSEPAR